MRLIQRTTSEAPMYYIGLDIHKKTISYCVKDASGQIHREGKIGSTRCELDSWIKTLPQPRMIAMEAPIFYERERQRGNKNRATLAVARKMVAYMLAGERKKQDFVPVGEL